MTTRTKALLASTSVLVLTVIHHVYGAVIYDTPWRLHIVAVAVPAIVLLFAFDLMQQRQPSTRLGKASRALSTMITALLPIAGIGLFEGGYNHTIKNILYFADISQDTFNRLFPPPTYEIPNDFLFEATGVLQFFLGLLSVYYLIKLWKEKVELAYESTIQTNVNASR
ncbi:MAG: hypothetical protein L0287_31285 [Anaerolineae bacterium]|nr:hypothetical protein [Anaerolineae bacterium]MCI0707870.1 hypothetical protein [Ignavibacteriota bacterium]MCI0707931.1 hypothetical protein [Ignavibacteriota bacterium]